MDQGGGGMLGGGGRGASQRSGAAAKPVKKLTISLKKDKPQLPENFEDETWQKLKDCVRAVHMQQPVNQSFEQLYKGVEDLCIHKKGESLYVRLAGECEQNIIKNIEGLVSQTPDPVLFLELVQHTWDAHCNQMSTIRSIFLYLDRTYVIQSGNVTSLWEMGLMQFRRHLEAAPEVQAKALEGLLTLIAKERQGDMVNRSLVRNLLRMLSSLGLYTHFEARFLEASEAFYRDEAQQQLQQLDVPSYLLYVERRLEEEGDRVQQYLDPQTRKPLVAKLDAQLLEAHAQTIIDKGFEPLMMEADKRSDDLRRMYVLLGRVGALESIRNALCKYVRKAGVEMVSNEDRDKDLVSDLLAFKELLDSVLDSSFFASEELSHAIKDSFETFINVRQNKPAELIAKFVDLQLRGGGKGTNDVELESLLDRVMTLFRYIQGKDVFEAFFKKDLAKRLLHGKSGSVDAEKSMISKLKQECGSGFTNKLEGMFKDMELSRDVMTAYSDSSLRTQLATTVDSDFQIHVLTTGYWPPYPPAPMSIPRDLAMHQEAFEKFYLSKHQGRRLAWQNSQGHATVKAQFGDGQSRREHMLQVSLYQGAILLLFNQSDDLSYDEIRNAVGMDEKELKVTLQSLACAKIKILVKSPKGRDVNNGDSFSFHSKFESKQLRIKVNSIQLKETQEENDKTTETVFQDRQYQVDAAVVRVMKARKSLAHTLLISELFKLLKFPVTPSDLKKRIESLIEREYLERDKDQPNVYNYLA